MAPPLCSFNATDQTRLVNDILLPAEWCHLRAHWSAHRPKKAAFTSGTEFSARVLRLNGRSRLNSTDPDTELTTETTGTSAPKWQTRRPSYVRIFQKRGDSILPPRKKRGESKVHFRRIISKTPQNERESFSRIAPPPKLATILTSFAN